MAARVKPEPTDLALTAAEAAIKAATRVMMRAHPLGDANVMILLQGSTGEQVYGGTFGRFCCYGHAKSALETAMGKLVDVDAMPPERACIPMWTLQNEDKGND